MALWDNQYPYTDFHELNLDYVLTIAEEMKTTLQQLQAALTVSSNSLNAVDTEGLHRVIQCGNGLEQCVKYYRLKGVQFQLASFYCHADRLGIIPAAIQQSACNDQCI